MAKLDHIALTVSFSFFAAEMFEPGIAVERSSLIIGGIERASVVEGMGDGGVGRSSAVEGAADGGMVSSGFLAGGPAYAPTPSSEVMGGMDWSGNSEWDITNKCLTSLTDACSTQVADAFLGKKIRIDRGCCTKAKDIEEDCWSLISDLFVDGNRFFLQIMNYCLKLGDVAASFSH